MNLRRAALLVPVLGLAFAGLVGTGTSGAATRLIQPGAYIESGGAACTANFVYNGAGSLLGRTYIGTAAHCVSAIGDDVADYDGVVWGDVAWIGDENTTEGDYAFIQVRPEHLGRVSTVVKGHSAPTGYTRAADTVIGDTTVLSGYGLGFNVTALTQERRQAVLVYDDAEIYTVLGPLIFGDSGGPVVHARTGKALGIVSRLCVGGCSEEGPTVEGLMAKAGAQGFTVTLRVGS